MGNLESFSRLSLQLTGHVDKRGSWITVAGFVVSQTSEVRLGFQINRLDGKAGVVFIRKSVKPSQPFEPGHLRTPWVEHEAGDGQRPFLYYLLGLVRDRSWARFVCCTRQGISILFSFLLTKEWKKEESIVCWILFFLLKNLDRSIRLRVKSLLQIEHLWFCLGILEIIKHEYVNFIIMERNRLLFSISS